MTTDDWILKHIGHASAEDQALFEKWCGPTIREFGPRNGLGRNGKPMPQGAGAHCIQWWRDVLGMIDPCIYDAAIQRRLQVLEIGFCIGLSARIMLEAGVESVTSVDPSQHEECGGSAVNLETQFPSRFTFLPMRSDQFSSSTKFNLAFIDGDHEYASIITDISICRRLGIKTIVFDDWHPHFGPHTQRAVIDSGLRVRAIIGNYALCEDDL